MLRNGLDQAHDDGRRHSVRDSLRNVHIELMMLQINDKQSRHSFCIQKVHTERYLEASKAGAWEKTRLLRRQTLV